MGSAVLALTAGWSAGIAIGPLLGLPWLLLLVAAAATVAAALISPAASVRLLALALAACLLGQARLEVGRAVDAPDVLAGFAGEVAVRGRIVEAPLPRGSRFEAVVEVEEISSPEPSAVWTPVGEPHPRVLLRAPSLRAAFGDRIETRGRLSRPRSRPGWPVEELLARRQIRWVVDSGGARVIELVGTSLVGLLATGREAFEGQVRSLLPEPHASLVAGMVVGARVGLPPELRLAMSTTGTTHLTAVSGANVAMVAGASLFVATGLLGRLPAGLIAIVGVWLYTLLVGAPPSALRAATMATVALVGYGLGRQSDAIVGLMLAVAALLAWDPGLALDLGFQLSATATAGLILLSPSVERRLSWLPRSIRGHAAVAVAAQLATLPLIVGTFQRLSLVSLPANVLAAPIVAPIMGLGALIAAFGSIPLVDVAPGWMTWLAASALLLVIETSAGVPGAVVAVGRSPAWLPVGWYAVLGCWVAAGSADIRAFGIRPSALSAVAMVGTVAMSMLVVVGWPADGGSRGVQVVLLDTEPVAVFVRSPIGGSALLVTSASSRGLAASVGAQLDLSESTVDVVVGPGGLRAAVDLPEVAAAASATYSDGDAFDLDGRVDESTGDSGEAAGGLTSMSEPTDVRPGTIIDFEDGVRIQVVDVRVTSQRTVLDLAVIVDDVAILLPGPGIPSARWADVAPRSVTVAALPASAISWARALPPRNWLLLVGEPSLERARGESIVPFLARREVGSITVDLLHGTIVVRTERCAGGRECGVDLPPPSFQSLLSSAGDRAESSDGRSPLQSGRIGDGR